jgi:hypothetical protein
LSSSGGFNPRPVAPLAEPRFDERHVAHRPAGDVAEQRGAEQVGDMLDVRGPVVIVELFDEIVDAEHRAVGDDVQGVPAEAVDPLRVAERVAPRDDVLVSAGVRC